MTEIMPVLKILNIAVLSAGDFANTFYSFSPGLRLLLQLGFVIFTPPPHGLDHRPQGLPEGAEAVFHVGRHGVVVDFFHDAVADHGFQGGGQNLLGET